MWPLFFFRRTPSASSTKKVLILRFSSLGDVVQALSAAQNLFDAGFEVHFAVRIDLKELVEVCQAVKQVWPLERREGFPALWHLLWKLRREKFTHVYDAHQSLRSYFLYFALRLMHPQACYLRRPLYRFRRWWWIQFKKNYLPPPHEGQKQMVDPLRAWEVKTELPSQLRIVFPKWRIKIVEEKLERFGFTEKFIALCPSAAHVLKRWPLEYWKELITLLPEWRFVVLGGVQDSFLQELEMVEPDRVLNLAGRLSLVESWVVLAKAQVVVSNDTGLLHMAEQLHKPTIALMGPAPFGYPSRGGQSTIILERSLPCRPCSKHGQGPCVNREYQKCLRDISATEVSHWVRKLVGTTGFEPMTSTL